MVITEAIALGWSVVEREGARAIWQGAALTVLALYLAGLSAFSISSRDVRLHRRTIFHLFSLTSTALLLLSSSAILPPHKQATHHMALSYLTIVLVFAAFCVSSGTKGGPKLHFPSDSIYSEKILAGTTTTVEDNVCESARKSFVFGEYLYWIMTFPLCNRRISLGCYDVLVHNKSGDARIYI